MIRTIVLVDCLEPAGAAQTEYCPGGERQKDRGHNTNHQRLQDNLPQRIDFIKTPAKQNDAAILPLARDKDHGFRSRVVTLKLSPLDGVGLAIDRQAVRYRGDIAVLKLSILIEQRRIIEPAQITCKSQLECSLKRGLRVASRLVRLRRPIWRPIV